MARTPIAVAPLPLASLSDPHAREFTPSALAGLPSSVGHTSPANTGALITAPASATACSSRAPLPFPVPLPSADATTPPRSILQILRKMRFIGSSPVDFDGEG